MIAFVRFTAPIPTPSGMRQEFRERITRDGDTISIRCDGVLVQAPWAQVQAIHVVPDQPVPVASQPVQLRRKR